MNREYKVGDLSQPILAVSRSNSQRSKCRVSPHVDQFGPSHHLRSRITGSLHMTIRTLFYRNPNRTFGRGETLQEYWWCTKRALDWGLDGGLDLIVDDGTNLYYTYDVVVVGWGLGWSGVRAGRS
uniref:Uncharacterized protein n=1 Tax=Cannabis sativa TaxID=3483 RepID=A0A803P5F7_CANSA